MRRRLVLSILAATLALGSVTVVPTTPAAAECIGAWTAMPSFTAVARTAKRIVVGTVVKDLDELPGEQSGVTSSFVLDVEEVLRGPDAVGPLAVDDQRTGARLTQECGGMPFIYVRKGDRIAIAFGGRLPGTKRRGSAAAWIEGRPDVLAAPEAERLSVARVRRIAGGGAAGPTASPAVSPSPDPSPAASTPPVGAGGPIWEAVTLTPGRAEPRLLDVIAYGTGFLAAGTSGPRERWALWRSADGLAWDRLSFPDRVPSDIRVRLAARGDEILVVASLLWSEDGDGELLAWSSPDGERWTRARLPGRHAALGDVGVIDGRWTVVGAWCMESCERWATWTSTDGRAWERVDVPAETADGRIGEILVGQDRLIGTATAIVDGSVTDWSVVASKDGDAWDRIGRWPGFPDGWIRGVETSTGFVAVGLGEARDWLAVWRSPDAVEWTELHREIGRWGVETVAAAGDAIVVGGLVLVDALADEDAPAALTTPDGLAWSRSVGDPMTALSYPRDVAINGEVALLLTEDRPGEPSAWRTELGQP